MSGEGSNGAAAVGTPSAARPATANDGNAAQMPAVPADVQRMRPSEFGKARREGTLAPRAPQQQNEPPKSTRQHIADVSKALEARQGSHVADPEQAGTQFDVEPNAKSPPGQGKPEEADAGQEQQAADPNAEQAPENTDPLSSLSEQEMAAKYKEWETSDLFPEEMLGKMHEVKVRGQTRYVDTNELRQGYMRHSDYTQRGSELKQAQAQFDNERNFYKQHFEAIRDPDQMLEIYERNGYSEQLERVAEKIAERRVEHRSLVRAAGHAAALRAGFSHEQINAGQADNHRAVVEAMTKADSRLKQTRQVEIENRKLSSEAERAKAAVAQQQHQQEVAKHSQMYANQLAQLQPGAFRAHGIQDTPQNQAAFKRHLGEVISLEGGIGQDGITRRHAMAAAQNLREEREDRLQAENGIGQSEAEARARRQAEARRALGPNRTGTGGGKPVQGQQATAKRASDFGKERWNGSLGK